jgi:hypothetical protein
MPHYRQHHRRFRFDLMRSEKRQLPPFVTWLDDGDHALGSTPQAEPDGVDATMWTGYYGGVATEIRLAFRCGMAPATAGEDPWAASSR